MTEQPHAPRFPATCVAHWPTGPVACCDEHAREVVGLGRFMGTYVPVTVLTEPAECANCVNEAPAEVPNV